MYVLEVSGPKSKSIVFIVLVTQVERRLLLLLTIEDIIIQEWRTVRDIIHQL